MRKKERGGDAMTAPRRLGSPDAKNRTVLLDAAEALLREEGYAAVTSRRLAAKAGLKPQLVHYYFQTMDELFLAVLARLAEAGIKHQARALAGPQPLWALWESGRHSADATLTFELIALSRNRPAIRAALVEYAVRMRVEQTEALARIERRGAASEVLDPAALAFVIGTVTGNLGMERAIGMDVAHPETVALVERYLRLLEGEREPR